MTCLILETQSLRLGLDLGLHCQDSYLCLAKTTVLHADILTCHDYDEKLQV